MRYLFTILWGIFVVACNQQPGEANAPETTPKTKDSELTLYMRHLEDQAKGWRDTVQNGGSIAWQPAMIDSMFTAIPTDGKIGDSLLFNNLGMAFKKEVQSLSTETHANLATQYNLMVTACVNCHRHFCPGPIKRIEKLRVGE